MKDIEKLSSAIGITIKDSNIKDVVFDVSEAVIDTALNDGVIKDIPILSSIYGFYRAGMSIQDKLFTKKLLTFLTKINDIPVEKRKILIEEIECNDAYKIKVGEKLLYIIDKCDDSEKAKIIGNLFSSFLNSEIDYDDFLRASKCIELTNLEDLKRFVSLEFQNMDFEDAGDLVGTGLMSAKFVGGKSRYDGEVEGRIECYPSVIGKKIQSILKKHE